MKQDPGRFSVQRDVARQKEPIGTQQLRARVAQLRERVPAIKVVDDKGVEHTWSHQSLDRDDLVEIDGLGSRENPYRGSVASGISPHAHIVQIWATQQGKAGYWIRINDCWLQMTRSGVKNSKGQETIFLQNAPEN